MTSEAQPRRCRASATRTRSLPERVDVEGSRVIWQLLSAGVLAGVSDADEDEDAASGASESTEDDDLLEEIYNRFYSRWPHAQAADVVSRDPSRRSEDAPFRGWSGEGGQLQRRSRPAPSPASSKLQERQVPIAELRSRMSSVWDDDGLWHFPQELQKHDRDSKQLEDEWHLYNLKRMDPLSFSLWFIACYSDCFYAKIPDYILRVVPHSGTLLSMTALYFFTQAVALLWAFLSIAVSIMCIRAVQYIDGCDLLSALSMHWLPETALSARASTTATDFAGQTCTLWSACT